MHNNPTFSEYAIKNIVPRKWWHHRWIKIIGICFIVFTILAVTLSLVLKLVIFAPKKPEIITTTPISSTRTLPQTTTTSTSTKQSGWSPTGSMITTRAGHTASVLLDGKVLVTCGDSDDYVDLNSAELYDPLTGTWSNTGNMNHARLWHTASVLPNGRVLVAGGYNLGPLNIAEL